jgi:mannonate dehydratase
MPETARRAQEPARRGRAPLKTKDLKTILNQTGSRHLAVAKVQTNEPQLYGIACGTDRERVLAVATSIRPEL